MQPAKIWVIVGLILTVLIVAVSQGLFPWSDRSPVYRSSFDADERYLSITHMLHNGQLASFVYDTELGQKHSIQSNRPGSNYGVRSQKLSRKHKGSIYVTHYKAQRRSEVRPGREAMRELYLCHLAEGSCEFVFSSRLNISYPIELDDGGLLFVGSRAFHHSRRKDDDDYLGYLPHDFYYRSPEGEIRQLTEGSFTILSDVNLANGALYFDSWGGYRGRVRQLDTRKRPRIAELLRFPFDEESTEVVVNDKDLVPIFYGPSELEVRPSVHDQSDLFAYLGATAERPGPWYYNLFVQRLNSDEVLFTYASQRPQSLYGPVVIGGNRLRIAETYGGRIRFYDVDIEDQQMAEILSVRTLDIAAANPRQSKIIYVEK